MQFMMKHTFRVSVFSIFIVETDFNFDVEVNKMSRTLGHLCAHIG